MSKIYLDDLPLYWRGRAKAFRILDRHRTESDVATLEAARIYEECADELSVAMKARRPKSVTSQRPRPPHRSPNKE